MMKRKLTKKKTGRPLGSGAAIMYRTDEFAAAYAARPRALTTRDLAQVADFPFATAIWRLVAMPFAGTPKALGRIAKVAEAIGFSGETHRPVTEREIRDQKRMARTARAYWRKARP